MHEQAVLEGKPKSSTLRRTYSMSCSFVVSQGIVPYDGLSSGLNAQSAQVREGRGEIYQEAPG